MTKTHSDLPWRSWAIFSYHRKFSENVWKHLLGLQTIVGEFSESGQKSLENHQKKLLSVCLYKQNTGNTRLLVNNYDRIYIFSFSTSWSLVRYRVEHSKRHPLSLHANILSSMYKNLFEKVQFLTEWYACILQYLVTLFLPCKQRMEVDSEIILNNKVKSMQCHPVQNLFKHLQQLLPV